MFLFLHDIKELWLAFIILIIIGHHKAGRKHKDFIKAVGFYQVLLIQQYQNSSEIIVFSLSANKLFFFFLQEKKQWGRNDTGVGCTSLVGAISLILMRAKHAMVIIKV